VSQKMLRSLAPPFDQNLRAFVDRKIPCELLTLYYPHGVDPDFDTWLEGTVKKKDVLVELQDLYSRFGILPAPVLIILAKTQQLLLLKTQEFLALKNSPKQSRTQKRNRNAYVKACAAALKAIEVYDAPSLFLASDGLLLNREEMEQEGAVRSYLKSLKHAISMIRPRKQSDIEMRFCAQTLADFFLEITGDPRRGTVGVLMKAVFPQEWAARAIGPKQDFDGLRRAALERARGPSINARRFTLQEALDLQRRDPEHERHWRGQEKRLLPIWVKALRKEYSRRTT